MAGKRERYIFRRYARNGLFAGSLVGLLVGVLVSGPNFYVWAVSRSLMVVFASVLLGAVVGRLAVGLVLAFTSSGVAGEEASDENRPMAIGLPGTLNPEPGEQVATVEGE